METDWIAECHAKVNLMVYAWAGGAIFMVLNHAVTFAIFAMVMASLCHKLTTVSFSPERLQQFEARFPWSH